MRRTAPALREIGIDIEFQGHQRDGSHISIKRFLLSENNDHKAHTVTDQPNTDEISDIGDGVTVVTDDSEMSRTPIRDIPGKPNYRAAKYSEY